MKLPLLLAVILLPLTAHAQNISLIDLPKTAPSSPLPTAILTVSVNSSPKTNKDLQSKIKELLDLAREQYMPDENGNLLPTPTRRGTEVGGKIKTVVSDTVVIIENMEFKLLNPKKMKVGDNGHFRCLPDLGEGIPGPDGLIHYTEVPTYPSPTALQVTAYLKSGKNLTLKKIETKPKPTDFTYTLTW